MNTIFFRVAAGAVLVALGSIGTLLMLKQNGTAPLPVIIPATNAAPHAISVPKRPNAAHSPINSGTEAFIFAAASSVDAVVHVQTTSLVTDQTNPWLSMLGMSSGHIAQGSGSGVMIDKSGILVTNHHVIQGAREVQVSTSDGQVFPARVVGSDPSTDLAVLEIKADRPFQVLDMGNSDEVQVGEWVLAVGNPLNLTSTVTAGIVSAKGRNIRLLQADASRDIYPVESFLQTDAAVNPGNSGGALVNLEGKLIGINTAIASQTGSYAGYSFAIPSAIVAKVVQDLREFGRVQRAYLGIQVDPRETGVVVASARPQGGAGVAGIKRGDQIVSINGIDVRSFPSLQEQLSKHRPGDEVSVAVQRGRDRRNFVVTLTSRAGESSISSATSLPKNQPKAISMDELQKSWGVELEPVSEDLCQALQIQGGVIIKNLKDGPWLRQGLRKGFIVLRIDGAPILLNEDIERVVQRAARHGEDGLLLEGIYANGERGFAGVAVPHVRPQPRK